MANNLTTNPMYVDTAAVIRATKITVRKFIWSPFAANKTLLLKDAKGNVVLSLESITGDPIEIDFGIHGFKFDSLTATTVEASSVLSIYLA